MKTRFYTQTLIALAVAIAAAACAVSQAQEQPIPPPAGDSALPANIVPGTPLAEVVKMVQAGVDAGTIRTYVVNSQSAFNLDADKIVFLKDEGVPTDLVNAMMERDKYLYAATVTPAPAPVTEVASAADTAPPPAEVTVNYFNDTLTPYGSWVDVEGYGRCWRPTVVNYDVSWRPYCDRGHWVYTDYGWYWDSDYSWGTTFHYGRWFRHAHFGWCWYPDTEWAPSWVTWRSGGEYCGWAPLPPLAVFRPGFGFFYRGASVALDFDFGLDANCFMFISPDHFCDRHPRSYFAGPARVTQIFHQTTVINNFNVNNHTIVNHGISVDHISSVTHHPIEPVHVGALPNAGRQGWRGEGFDRTGQHGVAGNNAGRNLSGANNELRHGPAMLNNQNNNANAGRHDNLGQPAQGVRPVGNQVESSHLAGQQNLRATGNNNDQNANRLQPHNEPVVTGNGHFQQSQPSSATAGANALDRRQTQNNWPSGGNEHGQSQNVLHEQQPLQPRPIHSYETPSVSASPQHGSSQLEQHQFVAPSQPRVEQHVEPVHSYSPPPPPPAPVQSQAHTTSSGSDHSSTSSTSSNKDKQNH